MSNILDAMVEALFISDVIKYEYSIKNIISSLKKKPNEVQDSISLNHVSLL